MGAPRPSWPIEGLNRPRRRRGPASHRLPTGSYAASTAWDRFEALVKALVKPDAWIRSTGWTDPAWKRFHASTFCMILVRDYQPEPAPLHGSELAWPAGVRPFASYGKSANPGAQPDNRLGTMPAAAAYELAASIATRSTDASVPPDDRYVVPLSEGGWLLSPWIDDPDGGDPVEVDLCPQSPGILGC